MVLAAVACATTYGNFASLEYFRTEMKSTEAMKAKAAERVTTLRKLLGTDKNVFAAANDPNGPFVKYEAGTDNGSKENLSAIYKIFITDSAEKLREKEMRDKPPTFEPSSFLHEVDGQIDTLRKQYCEAQVVKEFPKMANEVGAFLAKGKVRVVTPANEDAAKKVEATRAALLQEYLQKNQPAIQTLLGKAERVQFVDGHVAKIVFVKRGEGGGVTEMLPASLSMLVTYRTAMDKYFLVLQDCFLEYLNARLDKKREGTEDKKLLASIRPDVSEHLDGSRGVNSILARLNRGQVDFLIDLFLQLRRSDIPTEDEMIPDKAENWDPAKVPSVLIYVADYEAKNRGKRELEGSVETMMNEYKYYRLLHSQLYDLENYLNEEHKTAAKTKLIVDALKKKK